MGNTTRNPRQNYIIHDDYHVIKMENMVSCHAFKQRQKKKGGEEEAARRHRHALHIRQEEVMYLLWKAWYSLSLMMIMMPSCRSSACLRCNLLVYIFFHQHCECEYVGFGCFFLLPVSTLSISLTLKCEILWLFILFKCGGFRLFC